MHDVLRSCASFNLSNLHLTGVQWSVAPTAKRATHPSLLTLDRVKMRLALVTIACLAASASAARPVSPFGVPRGGSAVSDYAGLCEAVKGNIVEKAGQSVSNLLLRWILKAVLLSGLIATYQ